MVENSLISGVAIEVAIVSGEAPGSWAETDTVGKSTVGSAATGRKRYAKSPPSVSAIDRRIVATGRRMKSSEMFIAKTLLDLSRAAGLILVARVFLDDGRAVAQALLALDHHLLAGLYARGDGRDLVARVGDLDLAALDGPVALHHEGKGAALPRLDGDERHRRDLRAHAEVDLDADILSGPELAALVVEARLRGHGAGQRVDGRIDEKQLAGRDRSLASARIGANRRRLLAGERGAQKIE